MPQRASLVRLPSSNSRTTPSLDGYDYRRTGVRLGLCSRAIRECIQICGCFQRPWAGLVNATRFLRRNGWVHATSREEQTISGQQQTYTVADTKQLYGVSASIHQTHMGQKQSRSPDQNPCLHTDLLANDYHRGACHSEDSHNDNRACHRFDSLLHRCHLLLLVPQTRRRHNANRAPHPVLDGRHSDHSRRCSKQTIQHDST